MRCYLVQGGGRKRYAGTQADARSTRDTIVEETGCKKKDVAIEQAMYGKGERHGGNVTPFLEQPWVHYAKMHGRGFLTGQATKKLEEASHQREGEAFETEVLGAIVYAGMSVLKERGDA